MNIDHSIFTSSSVNVLVMLTRCISFQIKVMCRLSGDQIGVFNRHFLLYVNNVFVFIKIINF